jgi:hypothetical protein
MQALLLVVIVKSDSQLPPRRQVAAGIRGPGIVKITVEERFADEIVDVEGEEMEVANG